MIEGPRRTSAPPRHSEQLSRELLHRAHEVAGIGTFTIDLQSQIIHVSAEMAYLLRAGDEALDLPLAEYRRRFYHPDDLATAAQNADSAYHAGEGLVIEARVVRGDGAVIWVRSSSSVELGERGESIVVGVVLDITAMRAAASRASEHAALMQSTYALAGVGTYEIDLERRTIRMSPEMARLLGAGEHSIDLPLDAYRERYLHPEDRDLGVGKAQAAYAASAPFVIELRMIRGDGTVIWIRNSSSTQRNAQGQVIVVGVVMDITAARQAALKEREQAALIQRVSERLHLATGAADIGIWDWDVETDRLEWDDTMFRIFGTSRDAMTPTYVGWEALLTPETRERSAANLRRAMAEGVEYDDELDVRWPDGTVHVIKASALVVRKDGRPTRVVGVNYDVTAERRAQQALAASEALLQQFVRHTPAAVAMFDRDLRYLSASERWITDYHLDGQEVVGRLHYEVFPDVPERWKEIHRRVLAGAVERCDEDPFPRNDGTTAWLEWECRPWRSADGAIGGMIMFTQVITERKRSEERLRESERRFRALSENSLVGVYVLESGRITYVNEAVERMFGYERGELLGTDPVILFPPDERASAAETMRKRREGEIEGIPVDARGVRKDGTVLSVVILGVRSTLDGRDVIIGNITDVTDRRRAEQLVRESEERFRQLLESSLTGVYIAQDGHFVYASPSLEKIFGAAPGALVGTPIYAQLHPDDVAMAAERVRQRFDAETKVVHYEVRASRRDGTPIWLEILGSTMAHEGRPALFGNVLDVTARKDAESELKRSEVRFRTFIEKAPLAIGLSRNGKSVYVNEKFLDLWRYKSADDVVGRSVLEHWAPETRPRIAERVRRRALGESIPPDISLAERSDQTVFPAQLEAISIDLPDGPVTAAFITDETERTRAEEALRESELRLRQIAESIDHVFWLADAADARLLYVSPASAAVYGRRAEELYADPSLRLTAVHPEDAERVHAAMRTKQVRGDYDESYRIVRPDRSVRFIRDRAFPLRDANGRVYRIVGTASDITEQRSLEGQLRQSQKMEAIGVLAGGVAHDFNNLLAVILSYSSLLQQQFAERDPIYEDVQEIRLAGERAARLTHQLLAFSRQQVFQPRVVDLNEVVASTEKMLLRLIGADIELETVPAVGLAKVEVDIGQMEQVLLNLAVNARDAMPSGGRIRISVTNVRIDEAEAARLGLRAGRYVTLAVSDSGVGMDAATQTRIFEPFFTTKGVGKGTGLGLSTVFGIVQQSGGHIAVESEVGRGSTFRIWLPFVASALEGATVPPVEAAVSGDETILLVEDEDAVRKLARTILTRQGFHVLDARSGGDALVICEHHRGPIDLIVTDIVMPLISGEQLVERVRLTRPGVPAVFMSGYPDMGAVRRGLLAPELFVQKPFTPEALLRRVGEVLARARATR